MKGMNCSIYCDESCHLEHDGISPMVLGAVWCPTDNKKEISKRLIEIKARHGLEHKDELKWIKISSNHYKLYMDFIDYFFDDDDLHFRGLIVPDKSLLEHERFGQTHDEWYYKMFFHLLGPIIDPRNRYTISLDYKDTNGRQRIKKLRDVLCNNYYDFDRTIVEQILLVKSHHVELLQLTDILIGALTYNLRNLDTNLGKLSIIRRMKKRSGYKLSSSTLLREEKFNLFVWKPQSGVHP
jgi:hypothetical protein